MSAELIARLRKIPLLQPLSDEELAELAELVTLRRCRKGELIIRQNTPSDAFYVILEGMVRVWVPREGGIQVLNYHAQGDFFGELGLLYDRPRAANVEATMDTLLVVFDREAFDALLVHPEVSHYLRTWARDRVLTSNRPFEGKQWDEVGVVFTHKDWTMLAQAMLGPLVLIGLGVAGGFALGSWGGWSVTGLGVGAILLAMIAGLWAFWIYEDWHNDDYIVTTKRVIHIERVLLVRTERREVPIEQVQDVTVVGHGLLTLLFGCEDLVIKTAGAGEIRFRRIQNAEEVKERIFEVRGKALLQQVEEERARIRKAIRKALEPPITPPPPPGPQPVTPPSPTVPLHQVTLQFLGRVLDYFIPRVRIEEGDRIIWRKHWIVLLQAIFLPMLALLASTGLLAFAIWWVPRAPVWLRSNWFIVVLIPGLLLLSSLIWYLWRYDGWRRDVYIATADRIKDVEGSPFGIHREMAREGTYDVIQNIDYDVPNFFAQLLALGNVYIDTASQARAFTFESVYRPVEVQQEIFRRMVEYRRRREIAAQEQQAEEFAKWFALYHQEFEQGEEEEQLGRGGPAE